MKYSFFQVINLLKHTRDNNDVQIVVILDELDKFQTNIVKDLMDNYKELFFIGNIKFIFIVGQENYFNITEQTSGIENYKNYFSKYFYLPTLNWSAFQQLCRTNFGINLTRIALELYYDSLGLLRIAIQNVAYGREDSIEHKAIAEMIINITTSGTLSSLDPALLDIIKIKLKELFELVIINKEISISNAKLILCKVGLGSNIISLLLKEIMNSIINECTANSDRIPIGYRINDLTSSDNNILFYNKSANYARFYTDNFISPIYNNEEPKPFNVISQYTSYVEVAANDNYGFDKLIDIIDNRTKDQIVAVVTIEKTFHAFSSEQASYSMIVVIDELVGQAAYIAEDCSFTYEYYGRWTKLQGNLLERKIKPVLHYKINGEQPIKEHFNNILNEVKDRLQ